MFDYKLIIGVIAALIGVASYFPYIRDILKEATKPHAFSWLIWSLIIAIVFAGQIHDKGGFGAMVTGVSSIMCFIIFILSLFKGEKNITKLDSISLVLALFCIPLWVLTKGPLLAILLAVAIDLLGFFPTLRKSMLKPNEESISIFALSAFKFALGILALENFTLITALFPIYLVLANTSFSLLLLFKRSRQKSS